MGRTRRRLRLARGMQEETLAETLTETLVATPASEGATMASEEAAMVAQAQCRVPSRGP